MTISTSTSHNPRVIRNRLRSLLVLRWPERKAEVPARNTNTGAQKWVIHLVKNNAGVVLAMFKGSSRNACSWKKSRTWSSAIMIITAPLRISSDWTRVRDVGNSPILQIKCEKVLQHSSFCNTRKRWLPTTFPDFKKNEDSTLPNRKKTYFYSKSRNHAIAQTHCFIFPFI